MSEPEKTSAENRSVWVDFITDRLVRGVLWICLRLPWKRRLATMGWVLRKVIAPRVGWRDRSLQNLEHIWPDMSKDRKAEIADQAADNAGRTMIENYDVPGLLDRMKDTPLQGDGLQDIERARAEGRPVLFVTGHIGNFEAPRAALVARGWQIGGLYRPMANPFFNLHYAANMHAMSGPVFEQGRRGTMGLLKHVRDGGMAVLLFDVFDSSGEVFNFLGQPAPTLTSAADIALRTNALLVPFFGIRKDDGQTFDIIFEKPVPHGDPLAMMKEVSARLEARITDNPGQWFWIHRRWKPARTERVQRKRAAATIAP